MRCSAKIVVENVGYRVAILYQLAVKCKNDSVFMIEMKQKQCRLVMAPAGVTSQTNDQHVYF